MTDDQVVAPIILLAAEPNHRGDPELNAYGPFSSLEAATAFREDLYRFNLENGSGRSDIYLPSELGLQAPESHFIRDPEYLDDEELSE